MRFTYDRTSCTQVSCFELKAAWMLRIVASSRTKAPFDVAASTERCSAEGNPQQARARDNAIANHLMSHQPSAVLSSAAARGASPSWHRERRGAPMARRDD